MLIESSLLQYHRPDVRDDVSESWEGAESRDIIYVTLLMNKIFVQCHKL